VKRELKLLNAGFHLHPGYRFETPGRYPESMEKVLPYFAAFLRKETHYRVLPMLAVSEQSPDPGNRVMLIDERDATGMRRARIELRPSDTDMDSLHRSAHRFGIEFGRRSLGRIQTMFYEDNAPALKPDDHHMGSTRMDPDPNFGVVDGDCRVHGMDNLYVAGSSVFPACGFANPTLTLLALALRLCDHIRGLPS
jgi:choline dehydrogenase-like flavoprotein